MKIEHFVNRVFNSKAYVIYDDNKAIIIDMGDFEPVFAFITKRHLLVTALFITHTHYDHIYGVPKFMKGFPNIPIYTSEFGKAAFNKPNWNFSRYHNDEISLESDSIIPLLNNSHIKVLRDSEIIAFATPGHDKSCMTYKLDNMLFTGDSYIPGVKVIASFPNSSKAEAAYWYERLSSMAVDYSIFSGHHS